MLRIVILAVVAYFAWRYYGWPGAAGVIGAYAALSAILWIVTKVGASGARKVSLHHVSAKLSEAEKIHLAATREHQQVMLERRAQFDPDLRKRS